MRLLAAIRGRGPRRSYRHSGWLFLRLLGLVHLVAFVSLWVQLEGLVGAGGILPVGEFLERVHGRFGSESYGLLPTLSWISHSDAFLDGLCAVGAALSLLLLCDVAPIPVLALLWACYLSLQISGQTFLGFQWDILLLETGFTALFLAPGRIRPRLPWNEADPPRAGRWLVWLLLFKLMFLSGAVKLVCLDETWWGLTALDYHYFTQPLPLATSWYAHQLPAWFQRLSVLVMFAIELGAPLLIFGPRRLRHAACGALLFLQLAIAATGNYGFFNLLTAVLCLPLVDDDLAERLLPRRLRRRGGAAVAGTRRWLRWTGSGARATGAAAIALLSALTFVREIVRTEPPQGIDGPVGAALDAADRYVLSWGNTALGWIDPYNTVSGYGLFRAMTTARPEIVIEVSQDGRAWRELEFRWKPGDVRRRPALVAPHMPRLDWQMWFAALNPQRSYPWLERLLARLLEGAPAVEALLGEKPFASGPPRFVRLVAYDYEFTSAEERARTGAWWRRTRRGELTRALSRETFAARPN